MDDKEYMTLDEAAKAVGIKRPTIYHYIKKLDLSRLYFPFNRHAYLSRRDVERIKDIRESPWKVESGGETVKMRRMPKIKKDAA